VSLQDYASDPGMESSVIRLGDAADAFEQGIPREEIIERRRQALLVDLFIYRQQRIDRMR